MSRDVVVVGAGAIGCAIAWRLAQGRARVLLIDRQRPGGGASGAAAGILSSQVEGETPGPFLDLLLASERLYPALVEELRPHGEVGYVRRGTLKVAESEHELRELSVQRAWQRRASLLVEAWSGAELNAAEPGLSRTLVGANFFAEGASIDNVALVQALAIAARAAGVELITAEVSALELRADRVRGVRIGGELLEARQVVVAAGAWAGALLPWIPGAIVPVRGQLVRYDGSSAPALSRVVFGAGGYVVPRGGSLIVGATMERVGFDASVTAEGRRAIAARASRLCPALSGVIPAREWAGLRPATFDGWPALGSTPIAGLHLAIGHLRNGILLTPLTAELLASSVLEGGHEIPSSFAASRLFEPPR